MSEKLCVVIGVGPGLGIALARRFARAGYAVGLVARRRQHLTDFATEFMDRGQTVAMAPGDASKPGSIEDALGQIMDALGSPETLVYNAAVLKTGAPLSLSRARVEEELRVNVSSALACAQVTAPGMIERGSGSMLFSSGALAHHPMSHYASLSMGKAALHSLVQSLDQELSPRGIRCATISIAGVIAPGGPFDPDTIAERYWKHHAERTQRWQTDIPFP